MLHFDSDYMRGCHPEVMEKLITTNLEQHPGYGDDEYCAGARKAITDACGLAEADVFFLTGGTQTNAVMLDCLLQRWQGVICADSAHINVHEAGAVEATGHKVITLPSEDGKLTASQIRDYLVGFYRDETWTHMVEPGAVYITQPTEFGTIYTLSELEEISSVCREFGVALYLDGARLLYALASEDTDVTLSDIARLTDAFYIGGTKAGTLFGEAVVVPQKNRVPHFLSQVKRHGALLAKGRVAGVQFLALFENDLWKRIGRTAVAAAIRLRDGMTAKGYRMFVSSPTNQQFFVLPNDTLDRLMREATFEVWGVRGEKETPVRFVTDWHTSEEDIDRFLDMVPEYSGI